MSVGPLIFTNPEGVNIDRRIRVEMRKDDDSYDFNEMSEEYDVVVTITPKVKPFAPGYYRYIGEVDVQGDPGLACRTVTWLDTEPKEPEYVEGMENWEPVEVTRK